jgi:adenosine deaminase
MLCHYLLNLKRLNPVKIYKLILTLAGLVVSACQTQMDYTKHPKVELHLHLDCSLSYDVVMQLKPSVTLEEYKAKFVAPAKCTDLADYIQRAINGFELMQTKEQLRLVTLDLFKHRSYTLHTKALFRGSEYGDRSTGQAI